MVEGTSGLLALARAGEVARWSAAERRLVFANGAEAHLYSGASPQKLRGPEYDIAWCDELGKWKRAGAAWGADRVVAEVNQGGDMVASVLRAACVTLPLRLVRAARGKAARAEPVAALFENGRAGFAGRFAPLEAELAQFTAGGWLGEGSPDRADAMVWALWALCLEGQGEPGVRRA